MHDVTRERILSRLQQEFVANVSHELRTPLTTIKNYVETLLNGAQDDPGVRLRFLEVVDKETDRMVKLVKDLLVLSQMDYQETNWLREKSDVISLINEVLAQVELECRTKEIYLHDLLPERKIIVLLNKDKIRQVLLNLLDNAIKYTPKGGEIKVSVLTKYNFVWITVKDTGIGIPAKEVDRVFERFYRVDKTRSRDSGGTGLGLPIAKQIVEAHGGSIYLKSELEKGPRLHSAFPCRRLKGLCILFEKIKSGMLVFLIVSSMFLTSGFGLAFPWKKNQEPQRRSFYRTACFFQDYSACTDYFL